MPIEVSWYDIEETIRHWQFSGDWTGQEYLSQFENIVQQDERKPHPITVIFDFSQSKGNTKNALRVFRSSEGQSPQNLEMLIVVGNTFATTLVNAFNRMSRSHDYPVVGVPSLEKALALVNKQRETQKHR